MHLASRAVPPHRSSPARPEQADVPGSPPGLSCRPQKRPSGVSPGQDRAAYWCSAGQRGAFLHLKMKNTLTLIPRMHWCLSGIQTSQFASGEVSILQEGQVHAPITDQFTGHTMNWAYAPSGDTCTLRTWKFSDRFPGLKVKTSSEF